jgi:hypothetical protein
MMPVGFIRPDFIIRCQIRRQNEKSIDLIRIGPSGLSGRGRGFLGRDEIRIQAVGKGQG